MLESPVTKYLTSPVYTLSADADLDTARFRLTQHKVSCMAVNDTTDALAGVISRTDLLKVGTFDHSVSPPRLSVPDQQVRAVMHSPVITLAPEQTMRDAARAMAQHRVHRVFVKQGGAVLGVVGTLELLSALIDERVFGSGQLVDVVARDDHPRGITRSERRPDTEGVGRDRGGGHRRRGLARGDVHPA